MTVPVRTSGHRKPQKSPGTRRLDAAFRHVESKVMRGVDPSRGREHGRIPPAMRGRTGRAQAGALQEETIRSARSARGQAVGRGRKRGAGHNSLRRQNRSGLPPAVTPCNLLHAVLTPDTPGSQSEALTREVVATPPAGVGWQIPQPLLPCLALCDRHEKVLGVRRLDAALGLC